MLRQDPYDMLKYLIQNNMVPMDMVPKFVVWEKQFISESISDITNLLLSFAELANRENQTRERIMERKGGLTGDEMNCEMYTNNIEEFRLSGSEDKIDKARLWSNNPNLVDPAEHLRLMRTKHGHLGQYEDKSESGDGENNEKSMGVKPTGNEHQEQKNAGEKWESESKRGAEAGQSGREHRGQETEGGESTEEENESDSSSEESKAEEDTVTTKSRASSKKRKATTATYNTAEEKKKLGTEDEDDGRNKAVRSRRRGIKGQQLLLPNAERFAFQKKYELVKRLMQVEKKTLLHAVQERVRGLCVLVHMVYGV
jgi:hypothetical protein